jgi:hypothetical protein
LAQRAPPRLVGGKARVNFPLPIGFHREIACGRRDFNRGFAHGRRRQRRHGRGSLGDWIQAKVAEAASFRLLFIEGTTLRTNLYQSSFCAAGALRDACSLSAMRARFRANPRDVANRTTLGELNNSSRPIEQRIAI